MTREDHASVRNVSSASRSPASTWRRLLRDRASAGLAASGAGLVVNTFLQLVGVYLFIRILGAKSYGEWLVLTAIPSYLAMADFGVGSAAATAATIATAQGDPAGAARILQSAWTVTVQLCAGAAATTGALLFLSLGRSDYGSEDTLATLIVLTISTILWINVSFIDGALRATGHFARSQLILNLIRVVEFAATVTMAAAYRSALAMSVGMLAVRMVGISTYYLSTARTVEWFRLRWQTSAWRKARHILLPGISYMGFPVAAAIGNQGYTLMVAATLGVPSVVLLNSTRTFANTLRQIANVVTVGTSAELTSALARGDIPRAKKLLRISTQICALAGSAAMIALGTEGGTFLTWWTEGRVSTEKAFVWLMLATVAADIPWQLAANVLTSMNRHLRVATGYVASTAAALILGFWLVRVVGIYGVPISLFLIDVFLIPMTWVEARRAMNELSGVNRRSLVR